MRTLTLARKPPRKATPRREFVAWLTVELRKRGANLPDEINYRVIRDELERILLKDAA